MNNGAIYNETMKLHPGAWTDEFYFMPGCELPTVQITVPDILAEWQLGAPPMVWLHQSVLIWSVERANWVIATRTEVRRIIERMVRRTLNEDKIIHELPQVRGMEPLNLQQIRLNRFNPEGRASAIAFKWFELLMVEAKAIALDDPDTYIPTKSLFLRHQALKRGDITEKELSKLLLERPGRKVVQQ